MTYFLHFFFSSHHSLSWLNLPTQLFNFVLTVLVMSRHTQSPAKRHNNKRVAIFSSDESASDYDDGGGEDSDIQWMERPRKVQKKEKEKRDAPRARDPPRTGAGAGESKSSSVKQHTPPKTDSKAKSSHKSNNPDAETVKSSTSETPSSPASEEKKQKSRPYTAGTYDLRTLEVSSTAYLADALSLVSLSYSDDKQRFKVSSSQHIGIIAHTYLA